MTDSSIRPEVVAALTEAFGASTFRQQPTRGAFGSVDSGDMEGAFAVAAAQFAFSPPPTEQEVKAAKSAAKAAMSADLKRLARGEALDHE